MFNPFLSGNPQKLIGKQCRPRSDAIECLFFAYYSPGPSCSKLTTSLVNDSLKCTSSDMQIC